MSTMVGSKISSANVVFSGKVVIKVDNQIQWNNLQKMAFQAGFKWAAGETELVRERHSFMVFNFDKPNQLLGRFFVTGWFLLFAWFFLRFLLYGFSIITRYKSFLKSSSKKLNFFIPF